MLDANHILSGCIAGSDEDRRSLENVFQLANVAGPRVALQQVERGLADREQRMATAQDVTLQAEIAPGAASGAGRVRRPVRRRPRRPALRRSKD